MKVYFNPSCSKCRSAVEQLDQNRSQYDIVRYLEQPLSEQELRQVVDSLSDPVEDLVRKDKRFNELGLVEEDYATPDAVIAILRKHPELMQRPVITKDGRSHIARTPEKVEELV